MDDLWTHYTSLIACGLHSHVLCCDVLSCTAIDLQLAGQLRSLHKLPVGYVALDWHQMDKELGSEALVEAFWTQLSALLPPQVG